MNNFIKACLFAGVVGLGFSCEEKDPMPIVENPDDEMGTAPEVSFTALTNDNRIAKFDARQPDAPMDIVEITGVESGEMIVSIDYRPATGQLYGLGSTSRIYIINENDGTATPLGESSFSPAIDGDNPSLDFNPTVDRIRLVTASGQNLRLHPELGTVVATDGMLSGGNNPMIGAAAYTNSTAVATSTVLYDIDFSENKLFIQTPPNDGGLEEVGDLGIDFMGMGNFDINPDNSAALAVTLADDESKLYSINLSSGAATWVGRFSIPVVGIAFKTDPIAYAACINKKLFRFDPTDPVMNEIDIVGLMEGEHIVGLDFRPANGTLFGITNQSRILTINTSNGQTMAVGDGLDPMLEGEKFGFDFNPTVDRIRLVSNTGQNLRLHPDLGTVVAVDGSLNPGMPMVNGAAYNNSVAGATTTLLYVIDSETNMLYTQNPPNDGVLVPVGDLGVNISADNGFDIGGTSDMGYALLKVGDMTGVYSINLTTGAATKLTDFDVPATSMALGLGF